VVAFIAASLGLRRRVLNLPRRRVVVLIYSRGFFPGRRVFVPATGKHIGGAPWWSIKTGCSRCWGIEARSSRSGSYRPLLLARNGSTPSSTYTAAARGSWGSRHRPSAVLFFWAGLARHPLGRSKIDGSSGRFRGRPFRDVMAPRRGDRRGGPDRPVPIANRSRSSARGSASPSSRGGHRRGLSAGESRAGGARTVHPGPCPSRSTSSGTRTYGLFQALHQRHAPQTSSPPALSGSRGIARLWQSLAGLVSGGHLEQGYTEGAGWALLGLLGGRVVLRASGARGPGGLPTKTLGSVGCTAGGSYWCSAAPTTPRGSSSGAQSRSVTLVRLLC